MSSTEQERIELYELAKQEIGERFAELMIRALPPEPDELVRRGDLAATEQHLDTKIDGVEQHLGARIDGVEQRLDTKIDGVEQRLGARIDAVDARLSVVSAELRTEMRELTSNQTRTMMLGLVGSITVLTATELIVSAL